MGAGVVHVGRRAYAVGLYWENSPEGRVAKTAREAARQPGQNADFFAIRSGNKEGRVPQFGLGQSGAGYKAGLASFAACLANQQPGAWAGAFRLREGIAVVVVRDDLIVPDGDLLFADENDARDRLLQELSFGGLQKVYAPEAWSLPNADTMPVTLLLNERHDVVLRSTTIPKNVVIGAAVAAGLFLLVVGGGLYWQSVRDAEELKQRQEDAQRLAALAARNANSADLQKPDYPPPKRVWEEAPLPTTYVDACVKALPQVPVVIAGWKMTAMKCTPSAINTTWTRDSGIALLPAELKIDPEGTMGSLTVPLAKLLPRGHQDLLNSADITKSYLTSEWPGTLTRAADDPAPPPPTNYKGEWKPPPPPWVKRSFTFTVPELPSVLPDVWDKIPGVVVNSMSYSGRWTVEGVIYENRN